MSTRLLSIGLLLSILLIICISCRKEETIIDPPAPPACTIISPANNSMIQIGTIVPISVEVSGFADGVKVGFTVDTIAVYETGEAPYIFLWDTEGLGVDTIMIKADAYLGTVAVTDMIRIILIDTIIPLQAPVPVITITPELGTTDSIYIFDASQSYDLEDNFEDLLFRWDFEGDGEWDTDFSVVHTFEQKYNHAGHYFVALEVMDTDTMSADTTESIVVQHSTSPDPCGGIISIPYGGKVYHTVPIGEQCWLRENLDIGDMITENQEQSDNLIIEKYCYNNDTAHCSKYGGLYQWDEMMAYSPFQSGRGICPVGYHVPSDDEWKVLEGYVDSQYGSDDPEWDNILFRGYDAGNRLKAQLGWASGGNGNNIYGMKVLASGYWESGFSYTGEDEEAQFWTSTHDSGQNAFQRKLSYDENRISRENHWDKAALSVRCLKD